ncbi:MAG: PBP1A family penicillin-binding protein [Ignavibacteriae bacterium]|nr:PBP1A family penicillin-binding protein [Ignavibacteriota bacterium]MCB9214969.1 PBP1A family penicillin-binding protein [Ignavibacteria bacterium]
MDSGKRSGINLTHLRSAFGITIVLLSIGLLAAGIYLFEILSGLPTLEELENPKPDLSTRIFSADGVELDQFFVHNRRYIPYDSIAPSFFHALIATEDQKFYDHWGVSVERILKAAFKNLRSMDLTKEGASTITQQLARNIYLSQEVTMTRKLREQFTAIQIERTYTKREILEMYANTVYFGRGAYGIQVASEIFFNKEPEDLSIEESAMLVGMLKAPENYNPITNYEKALQRRNVVLGLMNEVGFISGKQRSEAQKKPIELREPKQRSETSIAAHFVEAVRRTLQKEPKLQKYNLYRDGLVIYTTIDTRMQRYANQAVREHLEYFQPVFSGSWSWGRKQKLLRSIVEKAAKNTEEYREALTDADKEAVVKRFAADPKFIDSVKKQATSIEVGFVVIEAQTGQVKAMVGGNDFTNGRGLNHVTQIRRQPGSAFKPFVYASAMQDGGMNPGSGVETAPKTWRVGGTSWSPKGGKGGVVSLRSALKYSINTAAARLIMEHTNTENVIKLAKEMGIKSPIPNVPSIALGTAELTPIEITAAFGTFPNNGMFVEPSMITKVEDRYGNVIYEAPRIVHDALDPKVAGWMVSMMQGVVDGGTATSIRQFFSNAAAGKTGTTQDFADAWFVGYTPELVAGIWVGFDDHRIKFTGWYGQGGKAAAPVWGRFMGKVYKDDGLPYEKTSFDGQPKGDYVTLPYNLNVPLENADIPSDALNVGGDPTRPTPSTIEPKDAVEAEGLESSKPPTPPSDGGNNETKDSKPKVKNLNAKKEEGGN